MKIFIASPIYRALEAECAMSFVSLFIKLSENNLLSNKHNHHWAVSSGDSNQSRARNILFKSFLESDADFMVTIDPDQVFKPEDILNLLSENKDVIVPLMNKRIINGGLIGVPLSGQEVEDSGNIIEMERIGFGIVVFSRSCIEKITQFAIDYGKLFLYNEEVIPEIVSQYIENNEWIAVDDCFSKRWRDLGGKLWLHTGIKVGHLGLNIF